MKKNYIAALSLGIVSLILIVVSLIILPDTVVTQLSFGSGNATTMPKLVAVAIPSFFSLGGAVATWILEWEKSKKAIPISIVGIAVFIIMLIVN